MKKRGVGLIKKGHILLALIILIVFVVSLFGLRFYNNQFNKNNSVVKTREVSLYFSSQNALFLKPETRMIKKDNLYINTLNELIKGPQTDLNKTIPDGVKVLGIKIDNKIAKINFNKALRENHWGGSTGERMTVYSIVNTMTQFSSIDKAQILIDGSEIETLVGHMDLTQPLKFNNRILEN